MTIRGQLIDIQDKRIFPAEIQWENKKITGIRELSPAEELPQQYLCPGFIDAHVHIESSMLIPTEFARLAVVHGLEVTGAVAGGDEELAHDFPFD